MTDLGAEIERLKKRVAAVERASRLGAAAIDDTALEVRDDTGSLRAIVGQQGDGTTAVNVVNGPTPPAPTAPLVASVIGGVAAEWDGQLDGGVGVPLDFARVEVHAAATPSFTPTAATLVGTIETAQGAIVTIPTTTPIYVRLLTRTTSGTASAPSTQNGPIAPALIVADDVADGIITGSKLSADAIDGKLITGATLRTAASGQRIVLAPSTTPGANALQMYSGAAAEAEPGQLLAAVNNDIGQPRPQTILWAPSLEAGTGAELRLISGGPNAQGQFNLTTGDGTGYVTRVYGYAADGATYSGRIAVRIDQPGITPYERADLTMSGDLFDWTDARGKSFSFSSDPASDVGLRTNAGVYGQYGQFSEEGDWIVPAFAVWRQSTNGTYQTLRLSRGAKRARLDGCAMVNTAFGPGQQLAFTIPLVYAPKKSHYFAVPNVTSGTPPIMGGRVDVLGEVTMFTTPAAVVNSLWDFSAVSWPLD